MEVRQKHSATCRIFNSFLGVCKCDETLSLLSVILCARFDSYANKYFAGGYWSVRSFFEWKL